MKIKTVIKANSPKQKIEKRGDIYHINLKSPAKNNRANKELINLLSKKFNKTVGQIKIKSGLKSKRKLIEIK